MNADFLAPLIGVTTLGGMLCLLCLKVLELMTQHTVLLAGQCLGRVSLRDDYSHRFRYRIRVQNLENLPADHSLLVTISAPATDSVLFPEIDRVLVMAGWKALSIVEPFRRVDDGSYRWQGRFCELPAFDTWSFDVTLPAERVILELSVPNVPPRRWLTATFGPHLEPNSITIQSIDDELRVNGPSTTPQISLPVSLSIVAPAAHLFAGGFTGWLTWSFAAFSAIDAWLIAAEICVIWVGYLLLRRPVYPAIQGYRTVTPPWPNQPGDEGSAVAAALPVESK